MRIFEAGSFGYDLSYEAQKRYADTDARAIFSLCARCLRRCGHNSLIRHLKTTYRQNYWKDFSLVFSALEFSLNQFFANKPTEFPYFDITHPRGI